MKEFPRPFGVMRQRPWLRGDGKWVDPFGKELTLDQVRDAEFADGYWKEQPRGMKETVSRIIDNEVNAGDEVSLFVNPKGFDDSDRRRLAAYRDLAREKGILLGKFKLDRKTHIATAPILSRDI